MTPLAKILIAQIRSNGPITVAEFMSACLLHPKHGYYVTRDPFGQSGDFTTAPEISQMFGELLGLALAQCWLDQGAPSGFVLAEIGPGRGTLMADVMRATAGVPGFHAAARLHLIEASPYLRDVQAKTLTGHDPTWVDEIDDLPDAPIFLLANEFFDALPIRQFSRHAAGWQEHLITAQYGKLQFALSDPGQVPDLDHRLADTKAGDIVELCLSVQGIITSLSSRIEKRGGVVFAIDYGGWRSSGDTLQAVRNHKSEDVFANPGNADITAHVDFARLADHAKGVSHTGLTGQGKLLERLGIRQRHGVLSANLSGEALVNHDAALERLIASDQMGTLFKAMALFPTGAPVPSGFDPCP